MKIGAVALCMPRLMAFVCFYAWRWPLGVKGFWRASFADLLCRPALLLFARLAALPFGKASGASASGRVTSLAWPGSNPRKYSCFLRASVVSLYRPCADKKILLDAISY